MGTDAAIDRVKKDLLRAFDNTRTELNRIEILAAGLAAFTGPVPSYEPTFHHLPQLKLNVRELASNDSKT